MKRTRRLLRLRIGIVVLAVLSGYFIADAMLPQTEAKVREVKGEQIQSQANLKPPKKEKQVALTFDDGPDAKYTVKILDILKKHKAKATFFVVGYQAEKHPDVLSRIVKEGHALGNHTWSHKDLTKLSGQQIENELVKLNKVIQNATGEFPKYVRTPYGAVSKKVTEAIEQNGQHNVLWNVDTRDWAGATPENMLKNVKANLKPGGIILMHSFGGKKGDLSNTIELLPKMIEELQEEGYSFVTVDELKLKSS
ncbi:polysaccharide deacetylase family protein [Paenibacillus sp. A3]|uniref:polysaccharide deacetylase family protein n=1 Tax=Paenibacillus sp. A3 TaxID=1337054 RepID=UPI0006D58D65|nr:polysaccharide deacetylase family protein [Paenibacillus sp. A3]